MNRTAKTIKMLQILSSGAKLKKKEIADLLEVNPRNINEYRKELEESGYEIEIIPGKEGGYRLKRSRISKLPMTLLSDSEWSALISASKYLEKDESFIKRNEFQRAITKIKTEKGLPEGLPIIHSSPIRLNVDEVFLKQIISELEYAINEKLYIRCEYISKNSKRQNIIKKSEYKPYAMYLYQNMWYAIFERNNANGTFFHMKLNRFKHLSITNKSFANDFNCNFKIENYIKSLGQVIDPITFIVEISKEKHPYFDEYIYGEQKILFEDSNISRLEISVENRGQAKMILKHLGQSAKIISPIDLRNEVVDELKSQLRQYEEV